MSKSLYLIAACCLLSVPLIAQSHPSAEGPLRTAIWVGASFSSFNPDYGCPNSSPFSCWENHVMGISPYGYTSPLMFNRIGAEGQAHFLVWHGPYGLKEASYLAGPNVRILRHGNLSLSGKFLMGLGHFDAPNEAVSNGNYFVFAPAGTVDYRLARRVSVRVDYEYQRWPGFQGLLNGSGHGGLTPNGLSLGASYAIR